MKRVFRAAYVVALAMMLVATGCNNHWGESNGDGSEFALPSKGLFVVNEGQWNAGNGEISFYDPQTKVCQNEIFYKANGMKLGDVAQSMTVQGDRVWVVSNNSHVVFALDATTFKECGRITHSDIISPRYLHFVSDTKAYLSQLYTDELVVINPQNYTVTGTISCPMVNTDLAASTEQMVQVGDYLYVTCWSSQRSVVKIDTRTDTVVGSVDVGIQPAFIVADKEQKLWVLTDGGGWAENPAGYEAPTLLRLNTDLEVEQTLSFDLGASISDLCIDGTGSTLYWSSQGVYNDAWELVSAGGVFAMPISSKSLPTEPIIGGMFYALTIDVESGEIYVSDAGDYTSSGTVMRYSATGEMLNSFRVGVCPGSFCWKR